jgi:hypothetical protein
MVMEECGGGVVGTVQVSCSASQQIYLAQALTNFMKQSPPWEANTTHS